MKTTLAIKTLFRTMSKTVFTFVLIAAITFTLFSQVAEYVTTKQEFESNIDMYKGTGTVEVQPAAYKNTDYPYYIEADPRVDCFPLEEYNEMGYAKITTDMINQIGAMQGVSKTYKRYMTGGRCSDIYRKIDTKSYDFPARLVVEGTLTYISKPFSEPFAGYSDRPGFFIENCKILAGQADIESITLNHDGLTMGISYNDLDYFAGDVPMGGEGNEWWGGGADKGVSSIYTPEYKYNQEYMNTLEINRCYVFVLRFLRNDDPSQQISCSIYDFLTEPWCPAIWDIGDAPENYLELPEYAPLKTCIDITNQDIHMLDVVYTDDMSVIQCIKDSKMTLTDGRWLTTQDTESGAKVCMISKEVAEENNLKIGDTLSIKLGDELFEQFYGLGAVAVTPERFADNWTDAELEIVGIYHEPFLNQWREPNWSYSKNTVFVPLSLLPVGEEELENHLYSPAEFSFEVGNAWDIEAFVNECIPQIEAMGLTVTFDDGGWIEVVRSYESAQQLALIRVFLLILVTLISTGFVVYLFVSRKKKDYAIMRALGTPKKKSATSLLAPLMVLTAAGVAVGVIAGVIYMLISSGSVSVLSIVICFGGEIALTLIFAAFILHKIGKRSPLELLQNSAGQKRKAADTPARDISVEFAAAIASSPVTAKPEPSKEAPLAKPKNPHHVRFVLRYIFRHMRRQALKSTLAILLAALMVGAITQFAHMKIVYNDLRTETVIRPRFVSSLALSRVPRLEKEGLAVDMYYEETLDAALHYGLENRQVTFALTNNVGRYTNEDYEIEFLTGYDESCFDDFCDYIVLGEALMEACDFKLGDTIKITPSEQTEELFRNAQLSFMEEYPDLPATNENIFDKYGVYLNAEIDRMADVFTIIGVIRTPSNAFAEMGFTSGRSDVRAVIGSGALLDLAEFRLADNTRVEEMRELGEEFSKGLSGSFIMDTSKLESVIRTSDLLNGLYPAAVAVALVIGAAMCALIVMQTSKDAAIMRAQGTTKRKTRAMLAVEQILLGAVGIAIGMCVMLAIKRGAFADIALQAGIFAAAYAVMVVAGSVVSAVFATKKNILELLQTKE